jgi:hypothetical protein
MSVDKRIVRWGLFGFLAMAGLYLMIAFVILGTTA